MDEKNLDAKRGASEPPEWMKENGWMRTTWMKRREKRT
jgi:hypothetical protein